MTNNTNKRPSGIVAERNELRDELEHTRSMLADLERYLRSDKFKSDPTVQVADVLTRLGRY